MCGGGRVRAAAVLAHALLLAHPDLLGHLVRVRTGVRVKAT